MAFSLPEVIDRWSHVYHLTARDNVRKIKAEGSLLSASTLMKKAGHDCCDEKRREHLPVTIGGEKCLIRDQKPLHRGNVTLEGGWTFEDLLQALNERVFFWPGHIEGPLSYG